MNEQTIYNYLLSTGMTPAGAAGMMGNMYAESGLIPNRVEMLCLKRLKEVGKIYTDATYTAFVDDGTISRDEFLHPLPGRVYGYGLVQWTTPTRKGKLYDVAKRKGKSIGDLHIQLDVLIDELKTSYLTVWQTLTTTSEVRTASDIVLKRFEMPADTGTGVQETRYKYSMKYYQGKSVTADMIIGIFREWIGWSEANGKYRQIIDIYNSHKPLARGYKVQYSDAWCDTTVSAAFIKAGNTDIIGGTECGVYDHVLLFRQAGIWKGRIKPIPGDIIVFDWQRDGMQDHIGIVERVEGAQITTIEGNYKDAVGRRTILYNDAQIAGYARPKYAAESSSTSGNDSAASQTPVSSGKVVATSYAEKYDPKVAGKYITTTDLNLRDGKNTKYKILATIPKGTIVNNYGYYSVQLLRKWLYIQVTIKGVTYVGFSSSKYLKKQK